MSAKVRYEVSLGGKWTRCTRANPVKRGFLEYAMKDGTTGLAQPGKWRVAEKPE